MSSQARRRHAPTGEQWHTEADRLLRSFDANPADWDRGRLEADRLAGKTPEAAVIAALDADGYFD